MPLTEQERQRLLQLKEVSTLSRGGPSRTQFDIGGQPTAQPPFAGAPSVQPGRAAGSFAFGLANQAALGLPEAGLRLAGQEPPPFGLLGGARGLGEVAGFALGGPAALARRGFGAVAGRLGTERLATQALASGVGGAAALGGAAVVPSVMAGEPERIPQQAAAGFGLGAVLGPLTQRAISALRRFRGPALATDQALISATPREQFRMGPAGRERSFKLREARIRERTARLKEKAQLRAGELEEGIQARTGQIKKQVGLRAEAQVAGIERRTFEQLRQNRIQGHQSTQRFKADKARLDKAIQGSQFELAKTIQKRLPGSMRKVSDNFRVLQDEAFSLSRGVRISEKEARNALNRFATNNPRTADLNPNFVDDTMESLG